MKNEIDGINYLNVSCDEIFDVVKWKDAKVIVSLLILAFINVAVIVGNVLVVLAVFISTKLRTVTNLFIVSLAVADLMVGIAVLPFSASWEIFEIWIFGELWCSMWLAVDVWMCTASILNLCVISLDRYVAVTRPVTYPSIMSTKKAKLLIAAVWILSFLICFPPLVGWNDRKRTFFRQLANTTMIPFMDEHQHRDGDEEGQLNKDHVDEYSEWPASSPSPEAIYYEEECTYTCELTNEKGYVLYSAIGSFFLPMFVMLFFYWKIYRAAVETTRAINQGFRTTKSSRLLGTRFEEQRLTLRIHRGRSVQNHHHPHSHSNCPSSPKPISSSSNNGRLHGSTSSGDSSRVPRSRSQDHLAPSPRGKRTASYKASTRNTTNPTTATSSNGLRVVVSTQGGSGKRLEKKIRNSLEPVEPGHRRIRTASDSDSTPTPSPTLGVKKYETLSTSSTEEAKPKLISKMGKRNIKAQVKRFRMETRAAKTLGIIVGCFTICWCPFFTIYVIRAFCPTCIPPLLFSILFWLGYCNSAINPCIYALFSKDFRFAFKKILCRCICQREKKPQPQAVPIFLSSLGEDSEGNNEHEHEGGEGSDSR